MYQHGACYIRVSTDDQTEYSPDAQLKAIKDYAKKNDIILTKEHIYMDEGISGKRADKRPAFMRMIATAKSKPKPFDIILVHKFDRFARSREDSVVYKSLLRKDAGIKVVSITESIEDDKFSVILEAMLEAMAEYYSLNLAEEVKKGMTEKAERGEFQTRPPLGYIIENKQLVIYEEEAKYIRLMFQKYISQEMNIMQIACYMNDLGLKTKNGNLIEHRTVEYILMNPIYIGKVRWTPSGKANRYRSSPDTIIKDSTHEPIIDIDTWNKAQERIKATKELYANRQKSGAKIKTWLKGLVYCGNCGRTLVNSGYSALQCNGYSKATCRISAHTKCKILEDLVLGAIKDTFEGKLEINIVPKASDDLAAYEFQTLQGNIKKTELREQRIKEAYQDGIDSLEEYKENKKRLEEDREKTIERLKQLKEELMNNDTSESIVQRIENAYELLSNPNIDMDLKYKTAHFLINKITYKKQEKTLRIEYK